MNNEGKATTHNQDVAPELPNVSCQSRFPTSYEIKCHPTQQSLATSGYYRITNEMGKSRDRVTNKKEQLINRLIGCIFHEC